MTLMLRRSIFRSRFVLLSLFLVAGFAALHAQDDSNARKPRKYKSPPLSARIEVTILRDSNGKPISDAHVIFHPFEGDKDKGYLELKTNEDGKAVIDVLPLGDMVRMQVIAKGYQTYGEDYKVDKDSITKEIRMKKPAAQYSVYKDSSADAGNGSSAPSSDGKKEDSGNQQSQPKAN